LAILKAQRYRPNISRMECSSDIHAYSHIHQFEDNPQPLDII